MMYVYHVPAIPDGDVYQVADALLWVEVMLPKGSYRFEYEEGADPEDTLPIAFHFVDESVIATISQIVEA